MSTVHMGLTAAGTTQGTALALAASSTYSQITTCTSSASGVQLPTALAGDVIQIENAGASTLNIFPQSGGSVAGGSADAASTLAAGSIVALVATTATVWRVLPAGKGVDGGVARQVAVAGATTLTTAQSGYTVLITQSSVYTITLPTASAALAGVRYKFLVVANGSTVTITAGSAIIRGGGIGAATVVAFGGVTNLILHATQSIAGDMIQTECDGTSWHTRAWATTAAAFTTS